MDVPVIKMTNFVERRIEKAKRRRHNAASIDPQTNVTRLEQNIAESLIVENEVWLTQIKKWEGGAP
jgi:hypothetical protein